MKKSLKKSLSPANFHKLCWILVVYTVLVIIWGAWVRISHSGDGCGNNWPLCDGAYIPAELDKKTFIEYFHRLTSGFYGIFVIIILFLAFKLFPQQSATRQIGLVTFFLMIIEALLGAALVLKGLVGENATIFRLVVMTLHQINSLLLTGSTVLLALTTNHELRFEWKKFFLKARLGFIFMLLPATGAWAALANTLFPSLSLQEGLAKDLSSATPWILKLRVIHPFIALSLGLFLVYLFFKKFEKYQEKNQTDLAQSSLLVAGAFSLTLFFGILTLLFLSPVWMKLVHLTLAQVVWISLVNHVTISLLSTKR